MRYTQVYDGDWIKVKNKKKHRMKCCDCGTVHDIEFRTVRVGKGIRVLFKPVKNYQATAAARRGMKT